MDWLTRPRFSQKNGVFCLETTGKLSITWTPESRPKEFKVFAFPCCIGHTLPALTWGRICQVLRSSLYVFIIRLCEVA